MFPTDEFYPNLFCKTNSMVTQEETSTIADARHQEENPIQYSTPLRRVTKDHDCSALYVGADFTEYQRSRVRLEDGKYNRCRGPIIFPLCFI